MSEANEPPTETVRRELKEELDLNPVPEQLLCIDLVLPHGPWDDSLMLIFDGGILDDHQITDHTLNDDKLRAFKFYFKDEAAKLLRPYVWRRASASMKSLEQG